VTHLKITGERIWAKEDGIMRSFMCVFVLGNVKGIKPRRMSCDANVALLRQTNIRAKF
jgi:hypothetical protein